MDGEAVEESSDSPSGDASRPVSFAVLDQTLWSQFQMAGTTQEFARTWLALQCRQIDGAQAGVVVLGEPDVGPYAPVASWPEPGAVSPELTSAAEEALRKRQGVMVGQGAVRGVALPIIVDDAVWGVTAIAIAAGRTTGTAAIRQLRLGAGWIEALLRREQGVSDQQLRDRTGIALDMLACVLEHRRFAAACVALVTELGQRLDADPVSIGFVRRRRAKVEAISHAAGFGRRMNLIRDIGAAMDEAIDQDAVVLYPPNPDADYRVTLAHKDLAWFHRVGTVLTVPMQSGGETVGALTLEWSDNGAFDEETVELCDAIASVVGPVLEAKRRDDRSLLATAGEALWNQIRRLLGPRFIGRKLATIVFAAVVAFFMTARGELAITAPTTLEGRIQRTVVAPFNSYLATENVRAGARVRAGETLATLDDQDLVLERLRWSTARRQRLIEYDRALAGRLLAEANIINSQIDQADAQLALIDEQLARTKITAPFDGIVVSGDLSQSVGATIERGQELFRIAPLDAYRVVLEVDEVDVAEIAVGQHGVLRLAAMPDQPLDYRIVRITPIAEQRDGRNFFRVEGQVEELSDRLRPNMVGVSRTTIDERLLIEIWTRRLVGWAHLAAWRWMP